MHTLSCGSHVGKAGLIPAHPPSLFTVFYRFLLHELKWQICLFLKYKPASIIFHKAHTESALNHPLIESRNDRNESFLSASSSLLTLCCFAGAH